MKNKEAFAIKLLKMSLIILSPLLLLLVITSLGITLQSGNIFSIN